MTKQEALIDFVNKLIENSKVPVEIPEQVQSYLDELTKSSVVNKPVLTDTGFEILTYMQKLKDPKNLKAKDIAEGMGMSSRKISGSMRKLVADQFVEKDGTNPVVYSLADKGKNFDLISFKETLNTDE